ncbi:TadE/TadG family type IV pilus assembly protein [Alterinioella nitratireducens]|uniref:TadE/TadG family type IV pilus assembly protein n=1 Tax=Alterinioella nitratireducens TaxID=2735915 RepID=UPI004058080D|tara:strand:- start:801 stop:1439 length:639 start_codon:yes stop_codon:yes gene_type:complete
MRAMIRNFWRRDEASVALEAVIVMPILTWIFIASFVFFDAFRVYNTSIKATYSVADVMSRRTNTISSTDIEGLAEVFQFLTRNTSGSSLRITQITRQTGGYRIDWSHGTDGLTYLRASDFPAIVDQIPIMAFGDRMLLVETFLPHRPAFNVGLSDQEFVNFTVTRPRFAGQVDFNANLGNSYVYENDGSPTGTDGFYYDGSGSDDGVEGGGT